MKLKISIVLAFFFAFSFVLGQTEFFNFKKALIGIKDQWHIIILPDEIFEKCTSNLSDLRIFGNKNNKIIEAPFILKFEAEKFLQKDIAFNLINQSKNEKGYFYTFEVPIANSVNQINLKFNQSNFDWKVKLEGSQNQQEWFTVLDGYRIVSIKNQFTNYHFTRLLFPNAKYQYFRLFVDSKVDPEFQSATLLFGEMINGNLKSFVIKKTKTEENKKTKQTIILVDLNNAVPLCHLNLEVKNEFDYYRPITIQYLSSSVKTLQGREDYFTTLTSGTLNSIEKTGFNFNSTIVKKVKIIIENQDNEPLNIGAISVKGYTHALIVRITEPADYFLYYGNPQIGFPNYDIAKFADKIPISLGELQLGDELIVEKEAKPIPEPPLFNQNSLWLVMILIIVILGWFSLKMIKQKE